MIIFLPRKMSGELVAKRTLLLDRTLRKQEDIAQNTGLGVGTLVHAASSPAKKHTGLEQVASHLSGPIMEMDWISASQTSVVL